jgi:hypothetical protein
VSIISGLIITWLFFSELAFYLSTDVQPELFVDTSRGEKLRINMDVTFPDLPCGCTSSQLALPMNDRVGSSSFALSLSLYQI